MKQPVHFLIIEDDEVDAEALTRAFQKWSIPYSATLVTDGQQALELLRGQIPDARIRKPYIILVDLEMPGMGGLEFLRALRQDPKIAHSVVFVCSASVNPMDIEASYEQAVAGYIAKSALDEEWTGLATLLEHYCQMVEFPPE